MVRRELSPDTVDLQWEARMGLSLRCSYHGRQRVLGTSRSTGTGEAEIKLGASAELWEKGTYMLDFGEGEPRSSVRGRSERWRHRG